MPARFSNKALEYDKIIDILKRYCISDCSREMFDRLEPACSKPEVLNRFGELRELIYLITNHNYPDIRAVHETSAFLHKALVKNSALSLGELVLVKENLDSFIRLKGAFSRSAESTPILSRKIEGIRTPYRLKERLERTIDERGNMREDATPELKAACERIKECRRRIEAVLEGYFNSPETRSYVQERQITLKDDRYVIPLKQSFKGKIPGVVHAYSGSGQTLFVEPFAVTEKNNELKLLQKERDREIERILVEVTGEAGACTGELGRIQDILTEVDMLLAEHRFMEDYRCTLPEFGEEREIFLEEARHPLLKGEVVPINFAVDAKTRGVVITGPNTGGKTVTLKMIGLFQLLAQSGIPVPAAAMRTCLFDSVCADIGDEQSIEQSLSTFSGHMKNIKAIVDGAESRSLILIDELGAGTDPVEGGAIGTAILDYLIKKNALTVVTTHFSSIKMYALESEVIRVASVQFDPVTCRPTFKLVMGIPGRSNALDIARNLGLRGEIIERANDFMGEKEKAVDSIFRNLGELSERLMAREADVAGERARLKELVSKYETALADLREKEQFIRRRYKKELAELLAGYRRRLESSVGEIRKSGASKESIKAARAEVERIEEEFRAHVEERLPAPGESAPHLQDREDFHIGEPVYVEDEQGERIRGTVEELADESITVRAGILRIKADMAKVFRDNAVREEASGGWAYESSEQAERLRTCDIRGMRYDEAMSALIRFLDSAVLSNLDTVTIIHGLGTGALRQGVWDTLKLYRYVEGYEYARPEMGGFGCTVVKLKKT